MENCKESDWNLFRIKIVKWQNRYIERVNKKIEKILDDEKLSPAERFWKAEKLIKREQSPPRSQVLTSLRSCPLPPLRGHPATPRYKESLNPLRIYLFGSYARGDYNAKSDYDFYIIVPDENYDNIEQTNTAYCSLIGMKRKPVDIVIGNQSLCRNGLFNCKASR